MGIDLSSFEAPKMMIEDIPERPGTRRIMLTYSSTTLFDKCKFEYNVRNEEWLVPRKKKAVFAQGHAFHSGIEHYYINNKAPMDEAALQIAMDKVDKELGPVEDGSDAKVKSMVRFFPQVFKDSRYSITHQEESFLVKMDEAPDFTHEGVKYEFWLSGKIDAFMEDKSSGKRYLGEWKTCTNFKDFTTKIRVDNQPWQYMLCHYLQHGFFPEGAVYRIARKASIRQKKTETLDEFRVRMFETYRDNPKEYFLEETVYMDPNRINRHIDYLNGVAESIKFSYQKNVWTRNTGACYNYNQECSYMRICKANCRSDFDMIAGMHYDRDEPNSELKDDDDKKPAVGPVFTNKG